MHAVSSADNVLGHLQLVQEGLGFAELKSIFAARLGDSTDGGKE